MGTASRYWRLVTLSMNGQRRVTPIAEARTWFEHTFGDLSPGMVNPSRPTIGHGSEGVDVSDAGIQRVLWLHHQQGTEAEREGAAWCLRCFVSYQIDQVCAQLAAQFGSQHGFTHADLLPFVLDDDGRSPLPPTQARYQPLAADILQTFDISRASLSTWVIQRVKRHPELNRFLLQQGVYRVSDWAILNDTTPQQLQRIFTEFHALTVTEVHQALDVLAVYHQVYRGDRLQQQQGRGQLCHPPTDEQLQRMASALARVSPARAKAEVPGAIMHRLRAIAAYLRHYRIHTRGGAVPTVSLDQPDLNPSLASITATSSPSDMDDQYEFLGRYRAQFLTCLDQAIAQVVSDRLTVLTRQKKGNPHQFAHALHLFHCVGLSMTEIAQTLGLQAQYQVTRLLKLKDFRADVRRRILENLGDRIHTLALPYADVSRLQAVDAQIATALAEHVDALMQQAETEVNVARHHPLKGLFACRLCHHLQHLDISHD